MLLNFTKTSSAVIWPQVWTTEEVKQQRFPACPWILGAWQALVAADPGWTWLLDMVTFPMAPVACARQWMVWTPTKISCESFWNLKVLISIAGADQEALGKREESFHVALFFIITFYWMNSFASADSEVGALLKSHTRGWNQNSSAVSCSPNSLFLASAGLGLAIKLPWEEWQKAVTLHPGPVTSRGVEPGHSHGNVGSASPGKGHAWFSGSDTNDIISCVKKSRLGAAALFPGWLECHRWRCPAVFP